MGGKPPFPVRKGDKMDKVFAIISQTEMGKEVLSLANKKHQILFGYAPSEPTNSSSIIVSWDEYGNFDVLCRFAFDAESIFMVEDIKKLFDVFIQKDDGDMSPESFALFLENKGFVNISHKVKLIRKEQLIEEQEKKANKRNENRENDMNSDVVDATYNDRIQSGGFRMLDYEELFGKKIGSD